jgi:nucleoside-diphosphate-sugar epimerase
VQRLLGRNLRLSRSVRTFRGSLDAAARSAGLTGRERYLPDKPILQLYQSMAIASSRKAEQAIGYLPRVSFEEGMRRTGEYLRQQLNDELV